jgi:hypothetical protein
MPLEVQTQPLEVQTQLLIAHPNEAKRSPVMCNQSVVADECILQLWIRLKKSHLKGICNSKEDITEDISKTPIGITSD